MTAVPLGSSAPIAGPITVAIVNARVWTGDPRRPWADAVAVRGGRLSLVGSSAEVRKLATPATRVIDARGALLAPGFIDSHVHFLAGGLRLGGVQLRSARTPEAFVERIRSHAATLSEGSWITGGDWDHERWGGELPSRAWIDAVAPAHPVWVHRLDGHMALANAAALRAAGITADTPDVAGGQIVRDAYGDPTGVLKDNAMRLVEDVRPSPSDAEADAALDAAMRHVAAQGVTSVHSMGAVSGTGSWEELDVYRRAHREGRLGTRIQAAVPLGNWPRLRDLVANEGRGDAWLRVGAVKGFVDGSLGSHTAAMLEPYTDAPDDRGLLVADEAELFAWQRDGDAAGLQLILHGIGDRAVRLQLDLFARIAAANGPRDRRWRIEHAQHLHPADIPRFAELGVIASMQPYHAIDDGRWADRVIGAERARLAWPTRALLDAGAMVAFGSDWFVAPPTPLEGIHAAVTRQTLDGANPGGWIPEQRIGVEDALRAYTSTAAFAEFAEHDKGMVRREMAADLVLIDRDLTRIAPNELREARILLTVVDGRIVYEHPSLESAR